MNFLAHLLLAPPTPHGRVGCLVPDLLRGPIPTDLEPQVLAAATEHQAIDRFTDRHPAFLSTRDRLRPSCDRYAGVVADIMLDHALAAQWADHHPAKLADYAAAVGQDLDTHPHLMPPAMRPIAQRMTEEDWLSTYATASGIRLTLARVSRRITERLSRPIDLTPAADTLDDDAQRAALLADFARIWPDLLDCVTDHRKNNQPHHRAAS